MAVDLNCPSCGSDATQRLSIVYEGGISDVNTSSNTAGVGIGRGGLGFGVARTNTRGISQTALSKKVAPPPKKKYLKPLFLIWLAFVIVGAFVGQGHQILANLLALAWLGASIGWILHAMKYNSNIWPDLKASWENSFLCNRCSHLFEA